MGKSKSCCVCEGERGEVKVTISIYDLDGVVLDYGDFCLECARDAVSHSPLVVPNEKEFKASHDEEG